MILSSAVFRARRLATCALLVTLGALSAVSGAVLAAPGPTGRVQGRVVATETGEPVGFADVLLVPADTTLKRVGGQTNADGTFSLEAAPGRYALQFRALSYARKRVEGVVIVAGQVTTFSTGLASEAIQQQEVVVEAHARQNTETSLLAARRKAAAVGDAVSAEQVRRSPDKDAAEVLRRVTGLSVSDGKYVYVRGLGERYSSTEVDGVRLASPEENKRVVPLDLLPAAMIENVVVQKTYTADRSGEFGGGDVQVRTRDFPGKRTWSLSVSQGVAEHVTFRDRQSYAGGHTNLFGFSADGRGLPSIVNDLFPGRTIPNTLTRPSAANVAAARSFRNSWSATSAKSAPNASYSLSYGDEFRVLGRELGIVSAWTNTRSYDDETRSHRAYADVRDTLVDYPTRVSTASAQFGGLAAVSYRLSPRHTIKLHGLYTNSADDVVRTYEGRDFQRDEAYTGTHLVHRVTELRYVERDIASGAIDGQHDFAFLRGLHLDWKLNRSEARRQQPDFRGVVYDKRYWYDGDPGHWTLGSQGLREFGDLKDRGWGTTAAVNAPLHLGALGAGRITLGWDRQRKKRDNAYRRFALGVPDFSLWNESPETIFAPGNFDTLSGSGYVTETTYGDRLLSDNYEAHQDVKALYASLDLPLGRHLRANLGLRREDGEQDLRSFPVFHREVTLQRGRFAHVDWLPAANLTVLGGKNVNLRLAASRTLSRPDLDELSPSPRATYVNDFMVLGNPGLHRALIDNYDARVEIFPSIAEVLAIGAFYKALHNPIEQTIQAGNIRALKPWNTGEGWDRGVEAEARARLGRVWRRLENLSVNTNLSLIDSRVEVGAFSKQGSLAHPLQGQANYLVNAAVSWTSPGSRADLSVLATSTGKRLKLLGFRPLPDVYQMPTTTLDVAINWSPWRAARLKLAAKNLLDRSIRTMQGDREAESYRAGRAYTAALTVGS